MIMLAGDWSAYCSAVRRIVSASRPVMAAACSRGKIFQGFGKTLESQGVSVDEGFFDAPGGQQMMGHSQRQGTVGARLGLQVDVGLPGAEGF